MDQILNPLLLLFLGFCTGIFFDFSTISIIACLSAICMATMTYVFLHHKAVLFFNICYFLLCCFKLPFLSYLPLIAYPYIYKQQSKLLYTLFIIPFIFTFHYVYIVFYLYVIICMLFSYYLKRNFIENDMIQHDYRIQRDTSRELSLVLTEKNHELLIGQKQKIQIATLNERNRIAREIHDNVGHLLSSSLLQIGAIQAVCKDEKLKEPLQSLLQTVSEGMDNVRNSVHNLHDESIMLDTAIQKIIQQFQFPSIHFTYDILHPFSQNTSYHVLAIIKECLTNIAKHSNGTQVSLILREHPAFYQLIVYDNGTHKKMTNTTGIGLKTIKERVDNLNGYINIDDKQGFQVFITLPKEEISHENTDC